MSVEIYPVVHVNEVSQGAEQSTLALESSADGVYLISHSSDLDTLLRTYQQVTIEHPDKFVGINLLQIESPASTFLLLSRLNRAGLKLPSGIWVDDAEPYPSLVGEIRQELPKLRSIRYLGGVAFKYTPTYTEHPEGAAQEAHRLAPYVDVVTTTGPGTGHPPVVAKIAAMREAIGSQRLAIASGISIENLQQYKPFADEVLVSTSIETRPYSGIFEEKTLRELIDLAHS